MWINFQDEIKDNEMKYHLTEMKIKVMQLQLKRANDELKLYVSNKQEDKKKSVREQLQKQILDQVMLFSTSPYWICLKTFFSLRKRNPNFWKKSKRKWRIFLHHLQNRSVSRSQHKSFIFYLHSEKYIGWFQITLWSNLEKLFEIKLQCLERAQNTDIQDSIQREMGTELLVL